MHSTTTDLWSKRCIVPPIRQFNVVAVQGADLLPGGVLEYRPDLNDPTALLYVLQDDLFEEEDSDGNGGRVMVKKLKPDRRVEPLILRAAAGDCLVVELENDLPATLHGRDPAFAAGETADLAGFNTLPMIVERFNANQLRPSSNVGLHPQLVEYRVQTADGMNVGMNEVQTAAPGGDRTYIWYAGNILVCEPGDARPDCAGEGDWERVGVPVEFGATNLMPADQIKQGSK